MRTRIYRNLLRHLRSSYSKLIIAGAQAAAATLLVAVAMNSCSSKPQEVPATFTEVADSATIYPDYREVTIPPNIAPLNFMVRDPEADAFVAEIGTLACGATDDGKIDIDTTAWHRLLHKNRGGDLSVNIYAHRANGWVRHPAFTIHVAKEEIDSFLSYRLIEPGYELYRQIGLYQRNLTNFDVATIYENNRSFEAEGNHCVNCHNYQNYDTRRMLFHVRAAYGGTIVTNDNEAHKITIRHDSILAAGVYPSWHPTRPWVAFATNKTGQVFHMLYPEKIEVLDTESDLIFYDAERNEVRNILRTSDHLETFPCWTPNGKRLYYCSARLPEISTDKLEIELSEHFDSLLYDLYSMPFDPETRVFGQPRLEIEASAQGMSCSVPRVSPDGRYLLFTLGKYGQFHIWHKSADLWVLPLSSPHGKEDTTSSPETASGNTALLPAGAGGKGLPYPLTAANSSDADSYHTWSSNGRWIVFSSRRDDGNFTRPYIAYFDADGHAHRAFLLPQRDPEYNLILLKSFNVPELTRTPVRVSTQQLEHVIKHTEAEPATYKE